MSAEQSKGPQPLSLFELLLMVRDGGLVEDARAWAAKWYKLGSHVATHYPGVLDRVDPTRHEFRPEALDMLRLCASGATVDKIAEALAKWDVYTANGVRTALAGLDDEIRAAAKLTPAPPPTPLPATTAPVERLHFDDLTHTVTLDGEAVRVDNPTAYVAFQVIAKAAPAVVKADDLDGIPGLRHKRIDRLLADLPPVLRECVKSQPSLGRWLSLPPAKNRP
jgi:hypothetical protein